MKTAIVTDLHFGARSDSLIFDNYFRRFYTEVFFPYIDEHNIKLVFDLGDTFDRRKYINFNILNNCRDYFFQPLLDRGIKVHQLAGNHDTYFKGTNEVNSIDLLLSEYKNITRYISPKTIDVEGTQIAMVPWICNGNFNESMDFLDSTTAQVVFGHLEIAGFEMHKGSISDHGFDKNLFRKFDIVASGHFHHKSQDGNIMYLGAPYEITWADFDDARGFHVFDTKTLEFEHIRNPLSIFKKLYYNDSSASNVTDLFATESVTDCYVKVIVREKTNPYWFDLYHEHLTKQNPATLQVIEDTVLLDGDDSEFMDGVEDTLSLLQKYCDQLETSADKGRIKRFVTQLYHEAMELE